MRTYSLNTAFVTIGMVILSGCASIGSESNTSIATADSGSMAELQAAQQRVAELESELATRDQRIRNAEAEVDSSQSGAASTSLFPPNPKVGACYARVLIPGTYRTVTEQVVKREAGERYEIIPARYETAEEQILVKEASTQLEVIPATYETVEEQILVRAASTKIVEIPAEYETVTEQVVDKPAHTAWKKGPAAFQSANVLSEKTSDTGEIMCLVEVPATYKTITKRVLRRPASTEVMNVPAEYKTASKRVVKTPATTREVAIPAQFETVQVTRLVAPATEKRIEIPAEYGVVSRTEKVSDANMEWRPVVCEVNLTRSKVAELQKALAEKGYYKIGIDGIIGPQTLGAAKEFAVDNDLPAGNNYVALEVVKALDLDIR